MRQLVAIAAAAMIYENRRIVKANGGRCRCYMKVSWLTAT
jgi:hypothetical protein